MSSKNYLRLLGFFFFVTFIGQGQESSKMIQQAWNLYKTKEYKKSAEKYSKAFRLSDTEGNTFNRYNAACSWALAKDIDSSFVQLFRIARKNKFSNYDHISKDADLINLRSDARWNDLLEIIRANKEEKEAKWDKPLVAILDTIYQDDQSLRNEISKVEKNHGPDSDEMKALSEAIQEQDSINLLKVQRILDEHGWLGSDIIGGKGNTTLFLVLQHADLKVQEKYLPMMREAVADGKAEAGNLALLKDRIALRQGKKQIYGSQIGQDPKTKALYVLPLHDPDNVDRRRSEVGLEPLQEYLSHWNLIWDVEKYKKELPELEAKQK